MVQDMSREVRSEQEVIRDERIVYLTQLRDEVQVKLDSAKDDYDHADEDRDIFAIRVNYYATQLNIWEQKIINCCHGSVATGDQDGNWYSDGGNI